MKNINKFLVASFLFTAGLVNAQTGIGTTTPDASAVLDVASSTKGFLLPRHTNLTRDAIVLPAKGLMIFNTTANELQTNTGTPAAPIWTASGVGPQGPQGLQGLTGATGPQGPIGLTGPAGPTGATGAQGPIGLTGPAGADGATGPQGPIGLTGPAGATGPQGPAGTNGISAYQSWLNLGNSGTEAQFIASLTGPTGATGAQGPIGLTGPAGATGPQGPIGLTGPAGADGATGPQGPIGLTGPAGATGPQGPAGTNGISAYQSWLNLGNSGTEAQFIASLTGPTGATGAQGPIGLTGPAGSDASVTGTAPIAVASGVVSLNDLGVTTAKLADNAVTIAKLPAGATASTYLRGDGTWVSIPSFTSVTLSKDATYTALNANEVTPNNVTTITFIGSSPANFTISNLAAGTANVGKILNIYNAGGSNITASFNRAGDGSAQSLTINSTRGFSMVWDGQGWARTSY